MGFKHLFGYSLLIAGIALLPLSFLFYINKDLYNPAFIYSLALFAFVFCIAGGFILKKLS